MFRFFGRRRSRDNVKERLKLVLSYDRAKLTPGKMEELKTELLGVIGKYFPSTEQEYDVRFEQHGERMVLLANLPMAAAPRDENSGDRQAETTAQAKQSNPADRNQNAARSNSGGKSRKKSSGKR